MKRLADVESFGGIDADADALLEHCFQDHEAYDAALNHKRFLIIGRKGAGKTAVFRKLVRADDQYRYSLGHTFLDYPWHHHDRQAQDGVPEEERYVHSWTYLVLMSLSKVLLNVDLSQPCSDEAMNHLSRLEKFIIDSYGSRDPDLSQVFAPGRQLQVGRPTFAVPGLLTIEGDTSPIPVKELPRYVQDLNRAIANSVLGALNPERHYYICFDQLDLRFDPNDTAYANRLIGLILAARNVSVKARDLGRKCSVVVFLRDDIYETLKFEDKNKLTENHVSRIEWDVPSTRWTLQHLMNKRFAAVLGIPEETAWASVFDEEKEMPGRQTKYKHILDRTFLRPRDIIKFCNETLEAFKADSNAGKFTNPHIHAARTA